MHEILDRLPASARVLDLGCRDGTFPDGAYPFQTVRVDINRPGMAAGSFIQADAERLPFRSRTFDAVILNHSLEHFPHLKPTLQELGRVVKQDGAAFVAVPDATTLSDRLYRKVYRNAGGHVNLFDSHTGLERMLSWYFGLPHIATRTLLSSFSFVNRKNTRRPAVRTQMRFSGLNEPVLALAVAGTRLFDRWFSARTGVYGWAFYFGAMGERVDFQPRTNVCVRCGQGHMAHALEDARRIQKILGVNTYRCPDCSACNIFFSDPPEALFTTATTGARMPPV